jgi:hypothetical protein
VTCAALEEYLQTVDGVFGLYCDSSRGFGLVVSEFDQLRRDSLQRLPNITATALDQAHIIYGRGDPNTPDAVPLHRVTQAVFRSRNLPDGSNPTRLGNMCLVMIFEYWETEYRARIADEMKTTREKLAVDAIGDIRLLRNSILHHSAVALPNVGNCKKFRWFTSGQPIVISKDQMETIVRTLITDLRAACVA